MSYFSGFVLAVPTANRQAYADYARKAWPMFQRQGATRLVEAWGDNVPDGKLTDFKRAVQARDDETVVFSWVEWPDRATAEAAFHNMQDDPDTARMGEMPCDGKRMIWGGFESLVDNRGQA